MAKKRIFPDVLTFREFLDYLRIGQEKGYKLIESGEIPARKVGTRWKIAKAACDNWLMGK